MRITPFTRGTWCCAADMRSLARVGIDLAETAAGHADGRRRFNLNGATTHVRCRQVCRAHLEAIGTDYTADLPLSTGSPLTYR